MTSHIFTGAQIRQDFIDFFTEHGHKFVPSSSLVPGDDSTLLFTNAGMVQFKEIFLGTDKRPYNRAVNSQKCMRVAGKHNDLDDVGRDNTHHTFFEMLGNWSFGDYYKKEAITWAWQLLTEVWRLPKENLWATCFRDDIGDIPQDDEAAYTWRQQPGFDQTHVLFFGRKENFWEMADTGPCGPCSEIHFDRGLRYCDKSGKDGHICQVNGDCARFLELWNLVFIQYDRHGPTELEPLPAKHVDTGMGLERIVSVLQDVDSNYKTDLLTPIMDSVQHLTGDTGVQREENITPYRVIADHARAASFLIADGVIPGNASRNYVCRMIIRRAARFGAMIGLDDPFIASVAQEVINNYGDFYPELKRNRSAILDNVTREEKRFQRTVEAGLAKLDNLIAHQKSNVEKVLSGEHAFDLYATYGLPFEITRDIAREHDLNVDETGFLTAMAEHRVVSGAGDTFGAADIKDIPLYKSILEEQQTIGNLDEEGVVYSPYHNLISEGRILAIIKDGVQVDRAQPGDSIEVILPKTGFYVESGGQVSDQGRIISSPEGKWEIRIDDTRKPISGIIVHIGQVQFGELGVNDRALAEVNQQRRQDIMRNHTATHLLHHELQALLGPHARQAGSLVAPDRLRFDFNHPNPVTLEQLEHIEEAVNKKILNDYQLEIEFKPLEVAIAEGAIALFGEKYTDTVRNIQIGEPEVFSNELCGGTHVDSTADIGIFLIISEGSIAAGIRRIEAITGRTAYDLIRHRFKQMKRTATILGATPDELLDRAETLISDLNSSKKQLGSLRRELARRAFEERIKNPVLINSIPVVATILPESDVATLRQMADYFRQNHPSGVVVLATVHENRPLIIAAITEDLVNRGLHAGDLVKHIAKPLGGSGGGNPTLAQAGGKHIENIEQALELSYNWTRDQLKN